MNSENRRVMIQCENLVKIYKTSEIEVMALQGLDLTIEEGELMAIIGNSGSGKSTLLNMLGGLDRPTAGKLFIDGKDMLKLTSMELIKYKRETVGFLWQNNARNLIPYLTALENIELPLIFMGSGERKKRALELLEIVGLTKRKNNKLHQLSGGEQQRVAIAIALSNRPRLLLADEPTGSVDTKTAAMILDIFQELNRNTRLTILIVTHDRQLSRKVDRVAAIRDGRTSSEFVRKKSYADELAEMPDSLTGKDEDGHVEYTVMDKAGRLQVPKEYLEAVGLKGKGRVRIELDGNRIVLLAPEELANIKETV